MHIYACMYMNNQQYFLACVLPDSPLSNNSMEKQEIEKCTDNQWQLTLFLL